MCIFLILQERNLIKAINQCLGERFSMGEFVAFLPILYPLTMPATQGRQFVKGKFTLSV